MKVKKGLVFGVFDGLHDGHKHFLNLAKSHSQTLVVVVAVDSTVEILKGKAPRFPLKERMDAIRALDASFRVVPGDDELDSWKVLKTEQPEKVFLGYDQEPLRKEFDRMQIPYAILSPHEPETFKSSFLLE